MTGQDRRVRPDDPGVRPIDDDPVRTPEQRNRVHVPTSREVSAGRVRDRDGRVAGHERDGIRERGDPSSESRTRAAERNRADGSRPGRDEDRERRRAHEDGRGCKPASWRADPRDPEHRRGDEERDDRRHAVVPRVRHRAEVREPVREQLRQRDGREAWGQHEEEEEREPEPEQVGEVLNLGQCREGSRPGP